MLKLVGRRALFPQVHQRACTTQRPSEPPAHFLHVAPDGDHWTGPTIFAAKRERLSTFQRRGLLASPSC